MSTTTPAIVSTETESNYHPSYCSEDANLVLLSNDGVSFRVLPVILRIGSEIFKNMLDEAKSTEEPVRLGENSDIVKAILDLIYPDGDGLKLVGKEFEFVWSLLNAADKYEIPKIKKEIRVRLFTDSYFSNRPLESYAIACRFSWKEEISVASTHCLDHVDSPESWDLLALLESKHALGLYKLISIRRQKFRTSWLGGDYEKRSSSWSLQLNSRATAIDLNQYKAPRFLLAMMEQELIRYPSGKSLKSDEFWGRLEISITSDQKEMDRNKVVHILQSLPSSVLDIS